MEEQILFMAKAFRARGSLFFPLFIRSMKEKEKGEYQAAGLVVGHLDLRRFSLAALFSLLSLIAQHGIEVVHWNFYHPLNVYMWLLTILKPRVAHYMTDHLSRTSSGANSSQSVKRWIKGILFRRYSKIGGISNFILEDLRKQGCRGNLFTHYYFINTERFKPNLYVRAKIRDRHNVADRLILLVVAHLIREKGVDVAVKALKELPTHVVLWIVGDGPERRTLQELVRGLDLEERAVFWGVQRNVEQYMQAADCFICPSLWAEAVGLVILEALGCGMPVIASKVGGIPEFIEEGRTGFLFPAGDHTALAERITQLLTVPMLSHVMGERARSIAVDRFSVEGKLDELLKVYVADSERSRP